MVETMEISDFEELRKLRLADEGYFVITDTARPAIVHRVNAKCITADSFNVKVVINKRKQGSYYWVDSLATAAHAHGAKRCKVCKRVVLGSSINVRLLALDKDLTNGPGQWPLPRGHYWTIELCAQTGSNLSYASYKTCIRESRPTPNGIGP